MTSLDCKKALLIKPAGRTGLTLDVGCGSENFSFVCLADVNVDIGRPPTKPNKPFIRCDASFLPFRDNQFVRITFFDVIEHVDAPTIVLREIKRVMAKGAVLILITPNAMRITNFLYILLHGFYIPHEDHVAVWGRIEMINLLRHVGFSSFEVKASTLEDSTHGLFPILALKLASFRQDLNGRVLIATARK